MTTTVDQIDLRNTVQTAAGNTVDVKGAQDGTMFSDSIHGEYAVAARAGRLFHAANQAAVATVTTLNTTWTGLGIANPTSSTKMLILREFSWMLTVVASDEGGLALVETSNSGLASAITPVCAYPAAGSSVAYVDNGATVVAGSIVKPVTTYGTGAITTWQGAGNQVCKISGGLIIPPGRAILTDTTTAITAAFIFGFLWEEVNLTDFV